MTYRVTISRGYGYGEMVFVFLDRSEAADFAEMAAIRAVARDIKVRLEYETGGESYE